MPHSARYEEMTDELIERAERLVPLIRAHAREAEIQRRIPGEVMEAVEREGLLDALVPKVYGGKGLGMRALCEVARTIARADVATAWVTCFFMEHNWMVCYYPLSLQRELFAKRSYIKLAGALAPVGAATRVPGGFRVTGRFKYCSGSMNAEWILGGAMVEEQGEMVPYGFLFPTDDVELHDNWHFAGVAATSSGDVEVTDVFVPENRAIPISQLHSHGEHPGAIHEESLMRYPILPALYAMMMAFALGCGERVIELGEQRLHSSAPWGVKRIDRESSRVRWLKARQEVRLTRLLYENVLETVIRKGESGEEWTLEETGQVEFDRVTIAHNVLRATRLIADGSGSSVYSLDDELQRYLRDIQVIANHIGLDWDLAAERDSRWLLGLGRNATDPHAEVQADATRKNLRSKSPGLVKASPEAGATPLKAVH